MSNIIFYRETNLKQTPIGKIPKDWEIIKLGSIINLRNGERPIDIYEEDEIPIYGANGIMGYTKYSLVEKEFTIVIGRVGASGQVHLASGKIWVSDNAIYVHEYDKSRVFMPFLYSYLKNAKLHSLATKTTHPIITQSLLTELLIKIPPLVEQRLIASVLSFFDDYISLLDQYIAKLERLKRGLMQHLLTKGIGHKEYKQTPIGKIPKTWQTVKLGDVLKIDANPIMPKTGEKYYYIGLEHIESESGRILKSIESLTDGKEIRSLKYEFTDKHILFGKLRPYLNKVAFPQKEGLCSTDLVPLLPNNNKIKREYLAYLLRLPRFVNWATARMRGTNHPRINPKEILNYEIPLPSLEEQEKIINLLLSLDENIKQRKAQKDKLTNIKRFLLDVLLSGRVRVKIG